mmetsp:Transcript_4990/g.11653  ORF Transcript_4990/g.11653 Transcript_4990/m.11653 type:complete len:219 (+) Transcript_4990:854-1510(+)
MEGAVIAVLADLEQPGGNALDGPLDRRIAVALLDAQLIGLGETQQVSPCVVQRTAAALDLHPLCLARHLVDHVSDRPTHSRRGTRHTLAAVQCHHPEAVQLPLDGHTQPPCPVEEGVNGPGLVAEAVADGGALVGDLDGLLDALPVLSTPDGVEGRTQISQSTEAMSIDSPTPTCLGLSKRASICARPLAMADNSHWTSGRQCSSRFARDSPSAENFD